MKRGTNVFIVTLALRIRLKNRQITCCHGDQSVTGNTGIKPNGKKYKDEYRFKSIIGQGETIATFRFHQEKKKKKGNPAEFKL